MKLITCDVCQCEITEKNQIDLSDSVDYLTSIYGNMHNPDLCFNCIDDLKKAISESVIQWKLKGVRK